MVHYTCVVKNFSAAKENIMIVSDTLYSNLESGINKFFENNPNASLYLVACR